MCSTPTCPSHRPWRWLAVCAVTVLLTMPAHGFHISMEYKPPVKSSVKKLYDQRFPRSNNNSGNKSSSNKSAYAGVYAPPPAETPSFERRMRDLVLGSPETRQRKQLPPNVHHVETLQEYKRVVGDEKKKIVAVRFYARK